MRKASPMRFGTAGSPVVDMMEVRLRTRAGCPIATSWAIIPPIEAPIRIRALRDHTYRLQFLKGLDLARHHFSQVAHVAARLPMIRVMRPIGAALVEEAAELSDVENPRLVGATFEDELDDDEVPLDVPLLCAAVCVAVCTAALRTEANGPERQL